MILKALVPLWMICLDAFIKIFKDIASEGTFNSCPKIQVVDPTQKYQIGPMKKNGAWQKKPIISFCQRVQGGKSICCVLMEAVRDQNSKLEEGMESRQPSPQSTPSSPPFPLPLPSPQPYLMLRPPLFKYFLPFSIQTLSWNFQDMEIFHKQKCLSSVCRNMLKKFS